MERSSFEFNVRANILCSAVTGKVQAFDPSGVGAICRGEKGCTDRSRRAFYLGRFESVRLRRYSSFAEGVS